MEQAQTDLALVLAAQIGDKQAFGQLVERYEPMAKQLALKMVGNGETARELSQEALLHAYLSLPQLRQPDKFASWFYGIVLNVCRSYRRSHKRHFFSLDMLPGGLDFDALPFASPEPGPQERAELRELASQVLAAVNLLSPKNREATLLFYYEQLSVEEMAALLDISVSAVKGRLHKARIQLRARLTRIDEPFDRQANWQERKKTMVKVTIADVMHQAEKDNHIIVLLDEAGQRLLPIWIGPFEAESIALQLLSRTTPRPLTYNFMARLLVAVGATLEEVRVEVLKETTFYAVAKLHNGQTVQEIDARPSDAIALALRVHCPIYVTEAVMEQAGIMIPEAFKNTPLQKGLATIVQHLERQAQKAKEAHQGEGEREAARQQLLTALFGRVE